MEAVGSRHGGLGGSMEAMLNSNFTIWGYNGHASDEEVEMMSILADEGIKIIHKESWWDATVNNPLDIYYNETFRTYAKYNIDYSRGIQGPGALIDMNDIWAVEMGDEEPGWLRFCDPHSIPLPDAFAKYEDEYYSETGFQLKSLSDMNKTENYVFIEWLNEKCTWVYNYLHDYIKSLAPHVLVFQYMIMYPVLGITEEFGSPYELKADGFAIDCFYPEEYPWLLYESIRRYRTSLPDSIFHVDILGVIWDFINEAGDGDHHKGGSYEQIRRETWISYLSDVEAVGYFDWAPQNNDSFDWQWGHMRTDIMGLRNWRYIDNLAGQLDLLPVFRSNPEVLVIGGGYQQGAPMLTVSELDLFTEYDLVSQRCFIKTDIDLSNYSLVMVTEGYYPDDVVQKLNAYVQEGGNLMFLGGIRSAECPVTTTEVFEIEENTIEDEFEGHTMINITTPNMLDLELNHDSHLFKTYFVENTTLSDDFHPITGFYSIDGEGAAVEVSDFPLLLYHNESNSNSGWVLYFGPYASSTNPDATWETYDWQSPNDLWYLYRKVVRAFASFLGITNSISTDETEDMLITQGVVEDGVILAGICNFQNENREFTYSLDLSQFDYPAGNYWIHSLDNNESLPQVETNGQILSFNTQIIANGTRLFLISEDKPDPSYSIDIFPPIPTAEDVSSDTTGTPTTDTSTTDTSTTSTIPLPGNELTFLVTAGTSILIISVIVMIILVRRRKQVNLEE